MDKKKIDFGALQYIMLHRTKAGPSQLVSINQPDNC